jgi:hypothetical protein
MDAKELVGPQGQPLIREPNLIVIKADDPRQLNQQFIMGIAKATRCFVVVLPMSSELLKGSAAAKELAHVHNSIHAVMRLPQIAFTKEQLECVQKAMNYLIRAMHIDQNAMEGRIATDIAEAIK